MRGNRCPEAITMGSITPNGEHGGNGLVFTKETKKLPDTRRAKHFNHVHSRSGSGRREGRVRRRISR